MVISLNCRVLETNNPAGPEYFTYNLFRHLIQQSPDDDFILYCNNPQADMVKSLKILSTKVKIRQVNSIVSWTHCGVMKRLVLDRPDVYFSTEHTLPIFSFLFTKPVVMIHGLEYKTNNELEKNSFKYIVHPIILKYICTIAKKVIVPSEYVRNELILSNYISDNAKTTVIREGVDEAFFQTSNTTEREQSDYLLFVSTLQPRKNLPKTIRAFATAIHEGNIPTDVNILLVGKVGWKSDDIFTAIKEEELEDRVKHMGWVEQDKLIEIYKHAKAFFNFSLEEGFGLPLLEAMASRIPTAVSNIKAHKELAEDTAIYADPEDIESIKIALIKLVNDPVSEQNLTDAQELAKKYSWQAAASKFIDLFKSVQ